MEEGASGNGGPSGAFHANGETDITVRGPPNVIAVFCPLKCLQGIAAPVFPGVVESIADPGGGKLKSSGIIPAQE